MIITNGQDGRSRRRKGRRRGRRKGRRRRRRRRGRRRRRQDEDDGETGRRRRDEEEEEEEKTGAEKGAGAVGIGFMISCVYLIIVSYHLFRLHDHIYPYTVESFFLSR